MFFPWNLVVPKGPHVAPRCCWLHQQGLWAAPPHLEKCILSNLSNQSHWLWAINYWALPLHSRRILSLYSRLFFLTKFQHNCQDNLIVCSSTMSLPTILYQSCLTSSVTKTFTHRLVQKPSVCRDMIPSSVTWGSGPQTSVSTHSSPPKTWFLQASLSQSPICSFHRDVSFHRPQSWLHTALFPQKNALRWENSYLVLNNGSWILDTY